MTYKQITRDSSGNTHIVEAEIDYQIPVVGDRVMTVEGDRKIAAVKMGVTWDWNRSSGKWIATPKMTTEPTPRIVFYLRPEGNDRFDYSWLSGEGF